EAPSTCCIASLEYPAPPRQRRRPSTCWQPDKPPVHDQYASSATPTRRGPRRRFAATIDLPGARSEASTVVTTPSRSSPRRGAIRHERTGRDDEQPVTLADDAVGIRIDLIVTIVGGHREQHAVGG